MIALLWFFLTLLASPFKSKSRLEAENAAVPVGNLRSGILVVQSAQKLASPACDRQSERHAGSVRPGGACHGSRSYSFRLFD